MKIEKLSYDNEFIDFENNIIRNILDLYIDFI